MPKAKRGAASVVANRLKEPSTWAGLGVIAGGLAVAFPQYAAALAAFNAIAGGVAVMQREQGAAGG